LLVAVGEFRSYVVEFFAAEVVPFRAADVAGSYVDACLCHNLSLFVGGYPFASPSSYELRHKPLRPSELHKIFPEATPRVLDLQLKELVEDGLVSKTIYPELPPRSEYAITPLGMTLIPIIDAMIEWGNRNAELFEKKYGKRE
jgi:DNA-binding HxlR family transcriptional regulator